MITIIKNNVKNIIGWSSKRRIIVFSVDDYGNVRLNSKEARDVISKAGIRPINRFDCFDSMETRTDLEMLFEALESVHDIKGNHAIFTAYTIPCNLNFEEMVKYNYEHFIFEQLPQTYFKLASMDPMAYEGTWDLWQNGMKKGFLVPQSHGQVHFNADLLQNELKVNKELIKVLETRSLTNWGQRNNFSKAFMFKDFSEVPKFFAIIKEGLNAFESIFQKRALCFTPPGGNEPAITHKYLANNGIKYIENPWIRKECRGSKNHQTILNYTGKSSHGTSLLVRNVVYEPTDDSRTDWIDYTLFQISCAFRWHKPAIISSHRVNFCGNIDQNNRNKGIKSLRVLLKRIKGLWPDVEFLSADQLGNLIKNKNEN